MQRIPRAAHHIFHTVSKNCDVSENVKQGIKSAVKTDEEFPFGILQSKCIANILTSDDTDTQITGLAIYIFNFQKTQVGEIIQD